MAITRMILALGDDGFEGRDILNVLERITVGCIVAASQNDGEMANFEIFCINVRDHLARIRFAKMTPKGNA